MGKGKKGKQSGRFLDVRIPILLGIALSDIRRGDAYL